MLRFTGSKITPEGTFGYEYDEVGNPTRVASPNGSVIERRYDAVNRVSQERQVLPGGYSATIGYEYDAGGNVTGKTTPWGAFSYQYDAILSIINL